ncbi:MAG TPA: hypothetical protein VGE32_13970, partial [Cellvibrio sp.]
NKSMIYYTLFLINITFSIQAALPPIGERPSILDHLDGGQLMIVYTADGKLGYRRIDGGDIAEDPELQRIVNITNALSQTPGGNPRSQSQGTNLSGSGDRRVDSPNQYSGSCTSIPQSGQEQREAEQNLNDSFVAKHNAPHRVPAFHRNNQNNPSAQSASIQEQEALPAQP